LLALICLVEREREREKERGGERERERKRKRERENERVSEERWRETVLNPQAL